MGGSGSSLFYPDNPKRRDRAEQLKNDCQQAKDDYERVRARLAAQLDPLQGKLDDVLRALGCNTLAELDQKVLNTATGQVLSDWKQVRDTYDTADKVEGIIWTACAIISLAGFAISVVMGVFSFGVGFAAGMTITAVITAIIGIVGLIYDAINGAIQRAKLREAINKLFETRLKICKVRNQIQSMDDIVPTIKTLYEVVIESGITDKEKIKQILVKRGSGIADKGWSYYRTAQDLNNMDRSRGSWTNEDPNWESMARNLDNQSPSRSFAMRSAPRAAYLMMAAAPPAAGAAPIHLNSSIEHGEVTTEIPDDIYDDADLEVIIRPANEQTVSSPVPIFDIPVMMHMSRVVSDESAIMHVHGTDYEKNEFILELLGSGGGGDKKEDKYAEVLLLNPQMPTQCLLPNGEWGTDRERGKLHIRYA